jgi:periplasmic divalent cation tolerance protein
MRVIYVSCRPDAARGLAERLVQERLVACASILPRVESVYRWEGRVEREAEAMLVMETSDAMVDAAMSRIEALHEYDVPKIVALEMTRATSAYSAWVDDETGGDG